MYKTWREPSLRHQRRHRRAATEATTSRLNWVARLHEQGVETARGGDPADLVRILLEAVSDVTPCACASVWLSENRSLFLSTTTDVHGATSAPARGVREFGAKVAEIALNARHYDAADRDMSVIPEDLRQALVAFDIGALDAIPMRARDGAALGVVALWFSDVTPAAQVPSPLIDLLVRHVCDFLELRNGWSQLTALLSHAEERAASATTGMRRRDEFLAMLSHELRQPLAAALPAIEVQQRSDNPQHRLRATHVIEQQLRQLTRQIDDLSDLSHIHRGSLVLRRQRVDLRDVLREAFETTASLASDKKHRRSIDLGSRPAWALVDVGRMTQVFSNLLRNAAVYTPDGGHIDLALWVGEASLELRLRDDGADILPEDLERIFKPFERAAAGRDAAGLGVGLAIVRQIVEMHGGSVSVASAGRDRGSEFVVTLPLDADLPDSSSGEDAG